MARIRQVTSITTSPVTQFILDRLEREAEKNREGFNKATYIETLIQDANPDLVKEFYK